jgi:GT2 family glycosyltransferase
VGRYDGQGVSVIVPVYESSEKLNRVLWGARATADMPFELIVAEAKQCVAKNRNKGLEVATQNLIVFLDDDILLPPFWMSQMAAVLDSNEEIGLVSAARFGMDLKPQRGFGPFAPGEVRDCLPPGTCFMYDRKRLEGCAFDETYEGSLVEDTDFVYQVKAKGLMTVATGDVVILHECNATQSNPEVYEKNLGHFRTKWSK